MIFGRSARIAAWQAEQARDHQRRVSAWQTARASGDVQALAEPPPPPSCSDRHDGHGWWSEA